MDLEDIPQDAHRFILFHDDLQFDTLIGSGGYGAVWVGKYIPSQQKVAIKKLFETELNERSAELYKREIRALATLRNPFLLPFVGFTTKSPFCIVTKFIPNESLYSALHSENPVQHLTNTQLNMIAFGIAVGMQYLHDNKVIHRDLKSQNVLLDDKLFPVICDFGSSKNIDITQSTMTGQTGTPQYMAPEFLQSEKYDEKVDVYSFGILLWEMITKQCPFDGLAWAQIMCVVVMKKQRPPIPDDLDPALKELISNCWDPEPTKRPTFAEIVKKFSRGEVAYPGTIRSEFLNILNSHSQTKYLYASYRRLISSQDYNSKKDDDMLQLKDVQFNKSCQFKIPLPIPIPQLRQTARSYLYALRPDSTLQQQLSAINFFDKNADSKVIGGIKLWEPLLKLESKLHPTIADHLNKLILKLAKRTELLNGIASVKNLSSYVQPNTMELFLYIITFYPGLIDEDITREIIKLLDTQHFEHAVVLLCKIIKAVTNQPNVYNMIIREFQSRVTRVVDTEGGHHIILALVNAREVPAESIPLFAASKITENAVAGYHALFSMNGVPRGFKLDNVCAHLKSDNTMLRTAALEFVRKYETKEEALAQVTSALIESFLEHNDRKALLLLCRTAASKSTGRVLTWNGVIELWMDSIPTKAPSLLKIFLILVQQKDFGPKFVLHKLTPTFLEHVLHHGEIDSLISALWVMTIMNMNKNYAASLIEKGTIATLCKKLCITKNEQLLSQANAFFVKSISFIDSPSLCDLIIHLLKLIKANDISSATCIKLISTISEKNSTHSTLINENAIAILNPFQSNPIIKPDVQAIINNMKKGGLNIP